MFSMKKSGGVFIPFFLFVFSFLAFSRDSEAMPNFARRYDSDCALCHTSVPKLNKFGYEFRLAGFRIPSEIGQEEKPFNLADYFTGRLQEQLQWKGHTDVKTSNNYSRAGLEFFEATLYPLTGAWGKYFSSMTELSMAPGDIFEVENAYVRGVLGNQDGWLQGKIGVMHPWEGFGAADRPVANTRPLFQKLAAIGSPFYLWNIDESALELGYHFAKIGTSISARVSNGIWWNPDALNNVDPQQGGPTQGGGLRPQSLAGKTLATYSGLNNPSFEVFANQFINDESALSVYWYRGTIPFPCDNSGCYTTSIVPTTTTDTFNRLAVYANFFVIPATINILAGGEYGIDSLGDKTVTGGSSVGNSYGYFGEVDYHATSQLAFGVQYSFFDPSLVVSHNDVRQYLISVNWRIWNGLQLITDYIHRDTDQKSGGMNQDNTIQSRLIVIF